MTKEYKVQAELLQAIISVLNEQPARVTRNILNALEDSIQAQDAPPPPNIEDRQGSTK